jgi:hypothetical protein
LQVLLLFLVAIALPRRVGDLGIEVQDRAESTLRFRLGEEVFKSLGIDCKQREVNFIQVVEDDLVLEVGVSVSALVAFMDGTSLRVIERLYLLTPEPMELVETANEHGVVRMLSTVLEMFQKLVDVPESMTAIVRADKSGVHQVVDDFHCF